MLRRHLVYTRVQQPPIDVRKSPSRKPLKALKTKPSRRNWVTWENELSCDGFSGRHLVGASTHARDASKPSEKPSKRWGGRSCAHACQRLRNTFACTTSDPLFHHFACTTSELKSSRKPSKTTQASEGSSVTQGCPQNDFILSLVHEMRVRPHKSPQSWDILVLAQHVAHNTFACECALSFDSKRSSLYHACDQPQESPRQTARGILSQGGPQNVDTPTLYQKGQDTREPRQRPKTKALKKASSKAPKKPSKQKPSLCHQMDVRTQTKPSKRSIGQSRRRQTPSCGNVLSTLGTRAPKPCREEESLKQGPQTKPSASTLRDSWPSS